jgi:hypothetical protein
VAVAPDLLESKLRSPSARPGIVPRRGLVDRLLASSTAPMVFVSGIVLRPQRRHFGLGLDSWVALVVYVLGVWGLLVVTG